MAKRVCGEHELLLNKVVTAATNYHYATLKLEAAAGEKQQTRFAEEKHNCERLAIEFRRAEAALREHEAGHGCVVPKAPMQRSEETVVKD